MKKTVFLIMIFFMLLPLFAQNTQARWDGETLPSLLGRVNDYAEIFSEEDSRVMAGISESLENETGWQMVFVTVQSLGGRSIEEYGLFLGRGWGIGQSEENSGLLVIAAMEEREVRIEVGYGLEGVVTDAMAGRIIDNLIVPAFRSGDFSGGFIQAADAVLSLGRGEVPEENSSSYVSDDKEVNIKLLQMVSRVQAIFIIPLFTAAFILSVVYFVLRLKPVKGKKGKESKGRPRKKLFLISLIVSMLFWLMAFAPNMARGHILPGIFLAIVCASFQYGVLAMFLSVIIGGILSQRGIGGTRGLYSSSRGRYSSSSFGSSGFSSGGFSSGGGFSGGGGSFGGGGASGGW